MKELKVKIEVIASDGVVLEKKELSVNVNEGDGSSIKKDRIYLEVGECLYIIDSDGYIKDQVFNINTGQKEKYGLWGELNKDTEHNNEDKKLPERCPCCFRPADFTDTITRDGEEYEADAWFCNICGGLVHWK